MTYRMIEKFKELIGDDPIFNIHAPFAPFFLAITWKDEKHPLHTFFLTRGRDTYIALSEKEHVAIALDIFRAYFVGRFTIEQLKEEYDEWESKTDILYQLIMDADLSKITDEQLTEYFSRIIDLMDWMSKKTLYIENVDFEKTLSIIGDDNKPMLESIWEKATEASFMSFDGRRLKKMIELSESGSNDSAVQEAKYIFTDYFQTKPVAEIAQALEDCRKDLTSRKDEYAILKKRFKEKEKSHEEWLNSLECIPKRIAKFLQLVMRLRDARKDPLAKLQAAGAELAAVALARAGIKSNCGPYILFAEYAKGIGYLTAHKEDIEKRKDGCMYMTHPDYTYEVEICDFDKAEAELLAILHKSIEPTDVLTGQVACQGKRKGIVRIIHDPHDDMGFKAGDILVTSMTRPEYLHLMKKAGAVVTNEGGITCHAAIVSRELGIPCIIGTKIATQVLKDGDMVEVDAEKGIVRKI